MKKTRYMIYDQEHEAYVCGIDEAMCFDECVRGGYDADEPTDGVEVWEAEIDKDPEFAIKFKTFQSAKNYLINMANKEIEGDYDIVLDEYDEE